MKAKWLKEWGVFTNSFRHLKQEHHISHAEEMCKDYISRNKNFKKYLTHQYLRSENTLPFRIGIQK